jgi:DnaJ-class molecular chaperone
MGVQVAFNTLCPACDGMGEVRVQRAIATMRPDGDGPASTALITEVCQTCNGEGKLNGFQPPV